MIRRGFWLTVGAVTGIMGYRRVAAIGHRLSGKLTGGAGPGPAVQTIRFARDVRAGMEQYRLTHSSPEGHTLGARRLPPSRGLIPNHDPRPKDGR